MSERKHRLQRQSNQPSVVSDGGKNSEVTSFKAEHYEGWAPHPSILKGLAEVDPEFPKKIMQWTEDQLQHDRKMHKWAHWFTLLERIINNSFGLAVTAILVYGGYLFMEKGYANQGATIIGLCIGSAGIFVIGKYAWKSSKG